MTDFVYATTLADTRTRVDRTVGMLAACVREWERLRDSALPDGWTPQERREYWEARR